MHWSFGMFIALVCACIISACLTVKAAFKRHMNVRVKRSTAPPSVRYLRTTRKQVCSPRQAREFASRFHVPRALFSPFGAASITVVIILALALWLYWRVTISLHGSIDRWMVWIFNVLFIMVAAQLVLASTEKRLVGNHASPRNDPLRTAVLIPLYNEDPDVIHKMLRALILQSTPPDEVHVVDDGSPQGDYLSEKAWFIEEASQRGIYCTWQRTPNQGKRRAQTQAFRQIRSADVFITVDSDSMLDSEAIEEITRPFCDPRVMSVAGVIVAVNNRTNILARITDMIFVGQQLIDRSCMSRLGSVLVNSGGLAAYRYEILGSNISIYLSEKYCGRRVEFSDDSMLTLFALLRGRTLQQPSAFAFAWMPDRWSHHYRQQVRWFRGSFIRGLWRIRFLPILSWGWWRQSMGWIQIWVVSSAFFYLVIWRPATTDHGVPVEVILVPLLIGLAQNLRYVQIWRSDTSEAQRYGSLPLSPLATLWTAVVLRPLRVWGMLTSARMGWNTRQQIEVTDSVQQPDSDRVHAPRPGPDS